MCVLYALPCNFTVVGLYAPKTIVNIDPWSVDLLSSSFVCLVWLKHNFRNFMGPALKWFLLGITNYIANFVLSVCIHAQINGVFMCSL